MIRSQVKKAADARARWEDDTYQDLMSRIDKARTMFNVELSSSSQHQQRIIGSNGAGKSYTRQDVLQGHYQRKSCEFTSHRGQSWQENYWMRWEFLGREGPPLCIIAADSSSVAYQEGLKNTIEEGIRRRQKCFDQVGRFSKRRRFWVVSLPSKELTYPIYLGKRIIIFRSVLGGDNLSS